MCFKLNFVQYLFHMFWTNLQRNCHFLICIFSLEFFIIKFFSFVFSVPKPSDFIARILCALNPTVRLKDLYIHLIHSCGDKCEVLIIRFTEQTSPVYCPTLFKGNRNVIHEIYEDLVSLTQLLF